MVYQWFVYFQVVGYVGVVDFGVDVVWQVGVYVQVLDQCQWIVGICMLGMVVEDFVGMLVLQVVFEGVVEEFVVYWVMYQIYGVEVGVD